MADSDPALSDYPYLRLSSPSFFIVIVCLLLSFRAEAYDVLCHNGNTAFDATFRNRVQVHVGPAMSGRLATRMCQASIIWGGHELQIADDAAEVDLDLFGVNLENNEPVAAFQIRKSEADCCVRYEIYSLNAPPQLVRTIKGAGYFRAEDTRLDGRVEIWTDDAAVINGFEGMAASEMEFPPTSVLRFQGGDLMDVTSEFKTYFDHQIAFLRRSLNPTQLQAFRQSDGKLQFGRKPSAQGASTLELRRVKTQVLEIAWAYLYSNRQTEALNALREMWPAADVERLYSAIVQRRAKGIRAQLDGVSEQKQPLKHAQVYDSTDTPARPIMIRYYPSPGAESLKGKWHVRLVVDCAGKVRAVKVSSHNKSVSEAVKRSSRNWKFIPAFADDHPVASRVRTTISLEQ